MLLALLLFITFLILFCSGDYDASRSIVYRCRVGDDCGGIGDRFTGIMGGAFYALLTGREFRIHWPDLVHVFTPQKPWLYAAEQLGVSEQQAAQIDNYYVRNVVGQELIPFVDGRPDIALLNDLNSRQITLPDRILEIEEYRHILFHSNRGPSPAMYEYFRWASDSEVSDNYLAAYKEVFDGMFQLSHSMLEAVYKGIDRDPMTYAQLLQIATHQSVLSVAYHHRVPDEVAAASRSDWVISDNAVEQIVALAHSLHAPEKATVLFFVTNCMHSAHKVAQSALVQQHFAEVYTQELQASIHVNYVFAAGAATGAPAEGLHDKQKGDTARRVSGSAKAVAGAEVGRGVGQLAEAETAESVLSLQQAMRDWWVLRIADVLVCSHSGFCLTAALLADPQQRRHVWTAQGIEYVSDVSELCMDRFC